MKKSIDPMFIILIVIPCILGLFAVLNNKESFLEEMGINPNRQMTLTNQEQKRLVNTKNKNDIIDGLLLYKLLFP